MTSSVSAANVSKQVKKEVGKVGCGAMMMLTMAVIVVTPTLLTMMMNMVVMTLMTTMTIAVVMSMAIAADSVIWW